MTDRPLPVRVLRGAALLLLAAAASACAFHRSVLNAHHRDLDPSRLVVGVSTWRDVLREFGPPAPLTDEELTRELPTLDYFRYAVVVRNTTRFTPGYWVSLPCAWIDEQRPFELMVEFDGEGVVSDVYARTEEAIWRPVENETDRPLPVTRRFGRPPEDPR